ncbi:MAG: DNA repair protein RecO [bacterium]
MTYNDIATPIKKTIYGEADIIYTFLTAHHGRIDAIAKGIRKSTSRKRGNIDYGVFSSLQLAKGKNMDVITEAQMIEYNDDLFSENGLKFLFSNVPLINRFASDIEHCTKMFETLKVVFLTYEKEHHNSFDLMLKYDLLEIQDLLPDFNQCRMCRVKGVEISKYSNSSLVPICNNCARKIETSLFIVPNNFEDIKRLDIGQKKVILNILNLQIRSIFSNSSKY